MNKVLFYITSSLLKFVSILPFPVLYLISDGLYIFLFYIIQYRRKVVQTNLANAFPGKTSAEREAIEKKYFKFLADMILESIKMATISETEMRRRLVYENWEEAEKYLKNGQSIIAVTGHYCNWEWGTPSISLQNPNPSLVVFKPLSDKYFEKLINKMRSRFGAVLIPMKQTLRKVIEYKNMPHLLVLVGDQTPPKEESQFFTTFLNQPTAVFLGVEKIAKLTNNPVIYFRIDRIKRGFYKTTPKVLAENPKETSDYSITLAHTQELERIIKERPEFWLWSHKRWKFKPEDVT